MLFTRECDYAIRIIRALSSEEAVSVPKICQMENLPSAMTYKLSRELRRLCSRPQSFFYLPV